MNVIGKDLRQMVRSAFWFQTFHQPAALVEEETEERVSGGLVAQASAVGCYYCYPDPSS